MNYRRAVVPGGMFFFTQVTLRRRPILCESLARSILHETLDECRTRWPFTLDAIVLLPDHFHTIWTLPEQDSDFSRRLGWLKKTFTQRYLASGGNEDGISTGQARDGRRGVWQPRFWEHAIHDERDLELHLNYICFNPVKHELARCPHDWPYSSFHDLARKGIYEPDWMCTCNGKEVQSPSFNTVSRYIE